MELNLLKKISDFLWEIPKTGPMRVPGRIFADQRLIEEMDDKVYEQVSNVACLPGIQKASLAMPDAHWGYGFCIGGVGAFDPEEDGVISVGGVGFDINCGVRTLRTSLKRQEVGPQIKKLIDVLFLIIPAGLGSRGKIELSDSEVNKVLTQGAAWVVKKGYGEKDDLAHIEEEGKVVGADPQNVSEMALRRERKQVGTLGSGNHYLEVQYVDKVYDEKVARALGLQKDQVLVTIHCGSRALGHQIGTDYLKILAEASRKYNIPVRERELVCAPINSEEGQRYFSACCCGINYAFANRQVLTHLTREGFKQIFSKSQLPLLYDIGHNTCKVEEHKVNGKTKKLYVHRKGATRAFGPNRKELPHDYQGVGQPVIIGGTMGTVSFILVGTEESEKISFASVCHGAGRVMSRKKAKKTWRGDQLVRDLKDKGIVIKAHSFPGLAEEAPGAYKDVAEVVDVIHKSGLSKKVIRMKPLGCIKG
jgi:tRNA-splicing ligase RtcB (3'-phosphate/5'-hydroxy nucleic acid ligase)